MGDQVTDSNVSSRPDRRVHARYEGMEIVRYNRAGKWYLEPVGFPGLKRQHIKIDQAARSAIWGLTNANGEVFFDLPGGSTFDQLVRS